MKNFFLIMVLSFIFLSCSSVGVKNNDVEKFKIEEKKEEELKTFSEEVYQNIKLNNIDYLRENTVSSLKNNYVLNFIEEIDFSRVPVLSGKLNFQENKGNKLIGIVFKDRTEYIDIKFSYIKFKWKIEDFKQRR